jgi:hypothetical protein
LSATAASTGSTGLATSSSFTTTTATTELATTFAATTSLAATEFTATTTASLSTTATALSTATAASSTVATLTGRGSKHTVTVELDANLLLAGTLTLGLASGSGHEVLLVVLGDGLAFGELGAGAFVGLTDVGGTRELLLSQLGEVDVVGLALVFRLGLGLSLSVLLDSLLLVGLSDGLASLFVGQLGVAVVSAPAVSSLLLVLADDC